MKGFIAKTVATACLAAGLVSTTGCIQGWYDVTDPCYPERYNFAARTEVCGALAPQVHNGHILDQTVWNWMWDHDGGDPLHGTDKLNGAGQEHLIYLLRRRPCPDTCLYLATAEDIPYSPEKPEDFSTARGELDAKRVIAIQKYLTAQTASRGLVWQVCVHDPAEPDVAAEGQRQSVGKWYANFQGALLIGGAGGGGGGGGAAAGH